VERTHSEDDRRRVALALTPEGVAVLETANQAVNDRLEDIASGLGSTKGSKALDNLSLWHDALRALRERQGR